MKTLRVRAIVAVWLVLAAAAWTPAVDWPQWMGPFRNGTSPESGLLTKWPADGPKVLWKVEGGDGYSSVAVGGDRAYTLVQRNDKEIVLCLDTANGKEVWNTPIGPGFRNDYGNGPRSTPSLDSNRVYVQSVNGPLVCLDSGSGKVVWQHDLLAEFKGKNITWGLSASPLVEGDLVYVIPGAKGAGVAAFHKTSGQLAWRTGDDKAAYASPVSLTAGGKKIILFFTAAGVLAVEPTTGKELWRIPWKTAYDCNICTPLVIGDQFFVSSGEQVGGTLFKVGDPARPPTVVWESKGPRSIMKNYWATAVAHDGYLYGLSGEFESVINLNCVDLKSGKLIWSKERFGKGSITLADGHLFITTKPGDLVLIPATPKEPPESARIKGFLGDNRTVPTIAGKRMYLRDLKHIWCLDLTP
jgi:outer membrane protein assembly factor BamB